MVSGFGCDQVVDGVLVGRDRMGAWIRPVVGLFDSLGGRMRRAIATGGGER